MRANGGFGLIATNTIAQGDTREVGLDQLVDDGWTVHRAIASEPWPGGANLEMATVWVRRDGWCGISVLDRDEVGGITSSLDDAQSHRRRARTVCTPTTTERSRAPSSSEWVSCSRRTKPQTMIAADPRNAEVVRPYLIGEDLNSRPDRSPSRWVIDFRDWSEERARTYREPFSRVDTLVRPERAKVNREAHRVRWWQFGDKRPALYRAIVALDRCIAITLVSKTVQPMFVPTGIVYAHKLGVFAYDDDAHFGLLSSGLHWWWTVTRTSTMRTDINYTPDRLLRDLSQPELTDAVAILGGELNEHRSALMLDRQEGLTKTYNRVHDPDEHADDIARLRELHVAARPRGPRRVRLERPRPRPWLP